MTDFKDRLRQACADNADIPLFNKGQQTFIAQNVGVSQEAVRKWFNGESKPKAAAAKKLAKLIKVNYLWLTMGSSFGELESEKKAAHRQDAAVYGFMAFLLLNGYSAAFDNEDGEVDIISIHGGHQTKFCVSLGRPTDKALNSTFKEVISNFPASAYQKVVYISAFENRDSSLSMDFLEIKTDVLKEFGSQHGNRIILKITNPSAGKFLAGKTRLPLFLE